MFRLFSDSPSPKSDFHTLDLTLGDLELDLVADSSNLF